MSAAATDFRINISAVDKTAATIKKITDSFKRFSSPLASIGKATGLDSFTKSIGEAADKLGAFGGTAGALAGVGSLGGMALLARQWAETGNQATLAAQRIGIGVDQLERLRGAARLGGIEAETMSSAVSAMAKNIGDARSMRDGGVMQSFFAQLGITPKFDVRGKADVMSAFRDLRDALLRESTAQGRNAYLEKLGLPQEIRPVIENIDRLSASASELRPSFQEAADVGAGLNGELARLRESTAAVGDNAERLLGPGLKKAIGWLADLAQWGEKATRALGPLAKWGFIGSGVVGGMAGGAALGAAAGAIGIPGAGALPGAVIGGIAGGLGVAGIELLGGADAANSPSAAPGMPMSAAQIRKLGAIRRNNPGNLRVPGSMAFQEFRTPGEGLVAAAKNLVGYERKHGINTIGGIVGRWAPPTENDTSGYIRDVERETGIAATAPIDGSAEMNAKILGAMIHREQGRQPFTPEQLATAIAAAMRDATPAQQPTQVNVNVTAPAGSTATANSSNANFWPTRVNYGMPTGATNP